jgi:hypothetical protein
MQGSAVALGMLALELIPSDIRLLAHPLCTDDICAVPIFVLMKANLSSFLTHSHTRTHTHTRTRAGGMDLADLSILDRMPQVEVLSLSINRVSTLRYIVPLAVSLSSPHTHTHNHTHTHTHTHARARAHTCSPIHSQPCPPAHFSPPVYLVVHPSIRPALTPPPTRPLSQHSLHPLAQPTCSPTDRPTDPPKAFYQVHRPLIHSPNIHSHNPPVYPPTHRRYFAKCTALRELYLRRNKVASFAELVHVANLTNLKVLWLSHNPVADHELYRATVIRTLPSLQKLDDTDVTDEERDAAMTTGIDVMAQANDADDDDGGGERDENGEEEDDGDEGQDEAEDGEDAADTDAQDNGLIPGPLESAQVGGQCSQSHVTKLMPSRPTTVYCAPRHTHTHTHTHTYTHTHDGIHVFTSHKHHRSTARANNPTITCCVCFYASRLRPFLSFVRAFSRVLAATPS